MWNAVPVATDPIAGGCVFQSDGGAECVFSFRLPLYSTTTIVVILNYFKYHPPSETNWSVILPLFNRPRSLLTPHKSPSSSSRNYLSQMRTLSFIIQNTILVCFFHPLFFSFLFFSCNRRLGASPPHRYNGFRRHRKPVPLCILLLFIMCTTTTTTYTHLFRWF